jgi:excisionase family DNA binding protein
MNESRATMTEAEFAKAVGVSRVTLWRMRSKGRLPHYRLGKRVLYGQHHVTEFLKAHERSGKKSIYS